MPVPHFNIKITQRSKGNSAVAGAAYQAGEKLFSEYDQKTKNYTCKKEVVYTEIMLPPNAPPEYADRATLWNSVEEIEKQWNSQLARRFVAALPREVPMELLPQMVKEYCEEQFVSKGMCCDFAIHDPDPPGHNPHCHFMLTMRAIDENGKWMPKSRKVYDLDENGERIKLPSGRWKSHKEDSELKGLLSEDEYAAARSSVLNAHYTSPTVIRAIYDAVEKMGFRNGNILEPSMGIGNFFGMLPDTMQDSRLYGVELDSVTGRIAQKLYPDANIKVAGFETTDRRDFYDLAVGNVPFGQYRVNDKAYNKLGFSIHNYFFAKAIDQVRPGGIVAFFTSRYTLDSKDSSARKHIAERANLLGAIRLPNSAFKANAGTEVVSDIIFLQKRDRPIDHEPDWVQLGKTEDGFAINSYFVDHPEMVLGELTSESTQYGREECTVRPIKGAVLVDQLAEAIQHIEGQFTEVEVETPDIADAENERHILPADPDVKNFSYTVVDGEVYYRENSVMTQVELSDTAKGRVTGMVELRQIVNELIDQQLNDYPDADIKATQEKLNTAYDAFSAKYGLLNDRKNGRLFEQDSSYYLLCSLENLDEQGRLKSKAAMFTKRTIRPECTVTNVDTPTEALAVSIGERGRVDLPYMAELLGTPGDYERITSELSGVIFKDPGADPTDPEAGWRMADEYLSGNVRAKLRMAQLAAETNPEFAVNVTALEKAQPKDLEASEIDVRLGATWLAPEIIQKFMAETFQIPYYLRHAVKVRYSPYTAEWRIEGKSAMGRGDIISSETYGTSRANAYKILEDTLNLKDVRIYDAIEDEEGKLKRMVMLDEWPPRPAVAFPCQQAGTGTDLEQDGIQRYFEHWLLSAKNGSGRLLPAFGFARVAAHGLSPANVQQQSQPVYQSCQRKRSGLCRRSGGLAHPVG